MAKVISLLNSTHAAPAEERRRLWLGLGDTMSLGRSLATAENLITREGHLPTLIVRNFAWGRMDLILIRKPLFDLRHFAPLILLPRAIELDAGGIPQRFFLEFIAREAGGRAALGA